MTSRVPRAEELAEVLCSRFCELTTVRLGATDDTLVVDTPIVLSNGGRFRFVVRQSSDASGWVASDDGYTVMEAAKMLSSSSAFRSAIGDFKRIAKSLDLEWDDEFSFRTDSFSSVAVRFPVLARATEMALAELGHRQHRPLSRDKREFSSKLKQLGLDVVPDFVVKLGSDNPPVRVDFLVRQGIREAAVEFLGAITPEGARVAVDRSLVNLHVLARGGFSGPLLAVYPSNSPAASRVTRQRFESAKPERAFMLSVTRSLAMIPRALAA